MKISVDGKEVLSLNETQCNVIKNDISSDEFQVDIERRAAYILQHKYDQCMKRLRDEWMWKLQGRVESVPTNNDAFAKLIFSQPDYKDRKARDLENVPDEIIVP